ncbi:MAG: ribonuclease HI family protein [Phycisphaeraceae bacterium]
MNCTIHIDGGARGNPGPAGAGVVIRDDDQGKVIHEAGYFLGANTNNVAEYQGLLRALELAHELAPSSVQFFSDSELLVRQILGEYRVKAPGLKPLHDRAKALIGRLADYEIQHIPREQNARADELANKAIDACRDVVVLDMHGWGETEAKAARVKGTGAAAGEARAARRPEAGQEAGTGDMPPGTGAAEAQPPCWVATLAGSRSRCQIGQGTGGEYTFGPTTPDGFCIYAAAAVLAADGPLAWDRGRTTGELRCSRCAQRIAMQRAEA